MKRSVRKLTARLTLAHLVIGLWLLALVSAIGVVTVRHQNRLAFVEARKVEAVRVELQSERGRLLLEKATWAQRRNIADDARRRLAMAAPNPADIITLKLRGGR